MVRLDFQPYVLTFRRPAGTSRGTLRSRAIVLLRAQDRAVGDASGWGECGPIPGLSRDDRPDFLAAVADMCAAVNAAGKPLLGSKQIDLQIQAAVAPLPSIAFGLETAMRDLRTGGRRRLWDTAFAVGKDGLATHGLIWMDTIDGMLAQIQAKMTAGFRVIKMKIGALPFAQELSLLRTIRSSFQGSQLEMRLDANGAYQPNGVPAILDQLASLEIAFLEQPIRAGQWPAMREICRVSPIPIALDEELIPIVDDESRQQMLETIRPQHLIIKPTLLGGFTAAEAWIAAAEKLGCHWWINSLLESNIGLNAICQWTSAIGGGRVHGLGTGQLFSNNIPSPLHLVGAQLRLDPAQPWFVDDTSIRP